MASGKRLFKNQSDGYVGVTIYSPRGEEKGTLVEPGATIFLSDDEIELTRDAPARAEDNPFSPQPFERRDPETDEVVESGSKALLVEVANDRSTGDGRRIARQSPAPRSTEDEVGAPPIPAGKLSQGSFAAGEEV